MVHGKTDPVGSIAMTVGFVGMTVGSVDITVGFVGMTVGSVDMTVGSVATTVDILRFLTIPKLVFSPRLVFNV